MDKDSNLPALNDKAKSVTLHDNGLKAGSIIEQSIRNLSQEQVSALGMKAAEKAIEIEAKARMQGIDYMEGRRATEDHIEAFDKLDKRGRLTSQKVVSEIKTGAGKMNIESKSGATCFVATATYGDINHPNVIFLRNFRDTTLSGSKAGRVFIDWYWENGPKLATHVANSAVLIKISKISISITVFIIKFFQFFKR